MDVVTVVLGSVAAAEALIALAVLWARPRPVPAPVAWAMLLSSAVVAGQSALELADAHIDRTLWVSTTAPVMVGCCALLLLGGRRLGRRPNVGGGVRG